MTDADRAREVAEEILGAPPGAEYTPAYAIAGLTLAVLHVGDDVRRLAGEQQAVGDEVSRLADAVQQRAIPVQRTRGGTGPRCD